MTTDAQLDKTVDEARAADVDAMSGGVTDSNTALALQDIAAYLSAAWDVVESTRGIIGFSDGTTGTPSIQLNSETFHKLFGEETESKWYASIQKLQFSVLMNGVKVLCLDDAEFTMTRVKNEN